MRLRPRGQGRFSSQGSGGSVRRKAPRSVKAGRQSALAIRGNASKAGDIIVDISRDSRPTLLRISNSVVRTTSIAAAMFVALAGSACSGSRPGAAPAQTQPTATTGLKFVAASAELLAACRSTARAVGYPVSCPMRVPQGLTETGSGGRPRCAIHIIGAGGMGGCAKSWRGWVIGSSTIGDQHLVMTASPKRMRNHARVVNGPAWYTNARVKLLAWVNVGGTRMRAVLVPPETNAGSAFADHVVLIWTVGDHTYGVGFHNAHGLRRTMALNEELAKHVRLIQP